jgi:hypothetical protein
MGDLTPLACMFDGSVGQRHGIARCHEQGCYEDRWTAYCASRVLAGEAKAIRLAKIGVALKEGFQFALETETDEPPP